LTGESQFQVDICFGAVSVPPQCLVDQNKIAK
jgi:hypothetical protein